MTATGFFGAGERAALLRDPEAFAARAEQVLSASVSKLRKLEAEADPLLESYHCETPLQVVQQRPAFFLDGVMMSRYEATETVLRKRLRRVAL